MTQPRRAASEILYALCAGFGLTAEHAAQIMITLDDAGYVIVPKEMARAVGELNEAKEKP